MLGYIFQSNERLFKNDYGNYNGLYKYKSWPLLFDNNSICLDLKKHIDDNFYKYGFDICFDLDILNEYIIQYQRLESEFRVICIDIISQKNVRNNNFNFIGYDYCYLTDEFYSAICDDLFKTFLKD